MAETLPQRIARRRLVALRRRARVAGAAGGSTAAVLLGVAFAGAQETAPDKPSPAACRHDAELPAAERDPRCPQPQADAATTPEAASAQPPAGPASGNAAPAEPAPVDPTPAGPASAGPTPAEPASAGPTPAEPASADLTPAEPVPADPTLADPASADLTPAEPVPADPTSADVAPADPASADLASASSRADPASTTALTGKRVTDAGGPVPAATSPAAATARPARRPTATPGTRVGAAIRVDARITVQPLRLPEGSIVHHAVGAAASRPATTSPAAAATLAPSPAASVVAWSGLAGLDPPLLPAGAGAYDGPRALLPIYLAAALEHGVPWELLAAINDVETDYGRHLAVSSAGAVGWMQFMPATWMRWGQDGDGDGLRDPGDPVDAIFAAAAYLKASGAPEDLPKAVFAYNHSAAYVADVMGRARALAAVPPATLAALTDAGLREATSAATWRGRPGGGLLAPHASLSSLGRIALLPDAALRRQVLRDASIYPCGQQDVRAGAIDRRVLLLLEVLAHRGLRPTVSSLKCGHGRLTSSGNVSEHTTGTAVDVAAINGTPVLGHQGPGTDAERVVRIAAGLPAPLAAHQVISLMTLPGAPSTLAMADHADHVHVGFAPLPRGR